MVRELVCASLKDFLVREVVPVLKLRAEIRPDAVLIGEREGLQVLTSSCGQASAVIEVFKTRRQRDLAICLAEPNRTGNASPISVWIRWDQRLVRSDVVVKSQSNIRIDCGIDDAIVEVPPTCI